MDNLKQLYSKDLNIMKYFREHGDVCDSNSMDAVLCAYDYQAGDYTQNYNANNLKKGVYLCKNDKMGETYQRIELTPGEFSRLAAKCLAAVMKNMEFESLLEVGVGEATTLCDILLNLQKEKNVYGIELSLSRLYYAQKFAKQKGVAVHLAAGDMFSLPFEDNSIDLVFTYYCIDAHRGKERQAVEEMLRVSSRYLILVEPTYELGNEETKRRIDEQYYIKNLQETLEKMDVRILEYRLFDVFTQNNNSAIIILEKMDKAEKKMEKLFYACPVCKKKLAEHKGNLYCDDCFNLYLVIGRIPVLLKDNAILCSKYLEF